MINKYSQFNPNPYEVHMMVLEKIAEGSRVLDVGCATGYFARKLREKKCKVWGIEQNPQAARQAQKYCEEVIVGDVDRMGKLSFQRGFFDYILLLDILEHLRNPLNLLEMLKPILRQDTNPGRMIISTPNIAHISIRLKLLAGKFDYEQKGIMDETHLRFYTRETFIELLGEANLCLVEMDYPADFGQLPKVARIARRIPKKSQYPLTRKFPTLLAAQFIAICQKK